MRRATSAEGAGHRRVRDPIPMDRLSGRPLLVMLDVDGTLAPIAPTPSEARVPDQTRRVIESLVTYPGVYVVLVSGRAARDARRMVGVPNVWTIGNHGAEVIAPNGDIDVDPSVERYAPAMAATAAALESAVATIPGATLEDKTWSLTIHYRATREDAVPRLEAAVKQAAAQYGLRVVDGKKIFEVRPPVRIHKGTAIANLAHTLGEDAAGASLMFAGDDVTDEDAFRLLRQDFPRAVTIHVGGHADADTAAEFRISELEELRAVLQQIEREVRLGG